MEDMGMIMHKAHWKPEESFWKNKRVLITGHTGFKGAWLSLVLERYGAIVYGLSLERKNEECLYNYLKSEGKRIRDSLYADIRESEKIETHLERIEPDVIFHLAAQPLVSVSYSDPALTWETNVIGTLNIMEAAKKINRKIAIIMSTTDKVYENIGTHFGYRETDRLGGDDPYSASKAAMELCVKSWKHSYGYNKERDKNRKIRICTVRAGNVIGGGDYALDRLIPDAIRSIISNKTLNVRCPHSTRPWQHVLEPLTAYIEIAEKTYKQEDMVLLDQLHGINIGPSIDDCRTVSEVLEEINKCWECNFEECKDKSSFKEAKYLSLSTDRAKCLLEWRPRLSFEEAIYITTAWYKNVSSGKMSALEACENDIIKYGL